MGGNYIKAYGQDFEQYSQIIVVGDSMLATAIALGDLLLVRIQHEISFHTLVMDFVSFGDALCFGEGENGWSSSHR